MGVTLDGMYVELSELTAYDSQFIFPQIFIHPINRIIGNYLAHNN